MASTNKTANFQLNQWARTDGVCMDDFNSDNSKIDAAISVLSNAMPHVAAGSYVGTGTAGSSSKNSLTFDFVPRLLIITPGNYGVEMMMAVHASSQYSFWSSNIQSGAITAGTITWGTTVSWYYGGSSMKEYGQFNASGTTYYYLAIG